MNAALSIIEESKLLAVLKPTVTITIEKMEEMIKTHATQNENFHLDHLDEKTFKALLVIYSASLKVNDCLDTENLEETWHDMFTSLVTGMSPYYSYPKEIRGEIDTCFETGALDSPLFYMGQMKLFISKVLAIVNAADVCMPI